ncbi:helix-turn-helix domain-containing protein [Candidatus Enterovibrio escicola]
MAEGDSFNQIAKRLGYAYSTISREIKRHILDGLLRCSLSSNYIKTG